ncbi:hypothetical protein GMMP15_1680005 [Candidatus Magnetomoraceae bacterium gMMP-15]
MPVERTNLFHQIRATHTEAEGIVKGDKQFLTKNKKSYSKQYIRIKEDIRKMMFNSLIGAENVCDIIRNNTATICLGISERTIASAKRIRDAETAATKTEAEYDLNLKKQGMKINQETESYSNYGKGFK